METFPLLAGALVYGALICLLAVCLRLLLLVYSESLGQQPQKSHSMVINRLLKVIERIIFFDT